MYPLMTHREEVEFGRRIGHHVLTAYRCAHNHVWYVMGPHIWCVCSRRIGDEPPMARLLCVRGAGASEHPCDAECVRRDHPMYRILTYIEHIRCWCGARTKGLARYDRATLRTAAAAHLIGGVATARAILGVDRAVPCVESMTRCTVEDIAAPGFPSNLTRW